MKIVPQSVRLRAFTVPGVIYDDDTEPTILSGSGAHVIEDAGRTCYRSEDKMGPGTAGPFIRMIRGKNHASVLEHASATFRIVCDRGVSHEIVRHRIASYSMESTRYCDYSKGKFGNEITVIQPPELSPEGEILWRGAMQQAELAYFDLLRYGTTPQIARSVLPTCLKTELVMTANFREWLHFIDLRTSQAAHPQMREVALLIRQELIKLCPEVFEVHDARRLP